MDALAAAVLSFARRHELWRPGLRVLAAVSGGSDSVAMACLLRDLAAAGDVTVAGLAHVNHHIRAGACDADEAFCASLAARLALPLTVCHADVPALAARHGESLEVAGRRARHRALADAAAALGADRIATAHTLDDQAETVLLHLVRGAGLAGARGIEPVSGARIRPLLACTHAELRAWLAARGETWCEDETNADLANPRNRLRHTVIPELRRWFNPGADAALARFADIVREDQAYLAAAAAAAAARLVAVRPDGVAIDAAGLRALPRALARRVARLALETAAPGRSYDLETADAVVDASGAGSDRDLPGVRMERLGGFVVLLKRGRLRQPPTPPFLYTLPVPGRVVLAEASATLEAELLSRPPGGAGALGGPWHAVVAADQVAADQGDGAPPVGAGVPAVSVGSATLLVRNRRPGDRVRVPGVGHKTLQDLFVDSKVDRYERDRVPIVTDRQGRIVWVAGHLVGEEFRVGPLTNTVVTLRLRPLEGAGRHR